MMELNKMMDGIRELGFIEGQHSVVERTKNLAGQFEEMIKKTLLFQPAKKDDPLLQILLSKSNGAVIPRRIQRINNPFAREISISYVLDTLPDPPQQVA